MNFFFSLTFPRLLSAGAAAAAVPAAVRQPRAGARGLPRLADLLFAAYLGVRSCCSRARPPSPPRRAAPSTCSSISSCRITCSAARSTGHGGDPRCDGRPRDRRLVLAAVGVFESSSLLAALWPLTQAGALPDQLLYVGAAACCARWAAPGTRSRSAACWRSACCCTCPACARCATRLAGPRCCCCSPAGCSRRLSRGPWVGAVAGLLFYVALGPRPARNVLSCSQAVGLAAAAVASRSCPSATSSSTCFPSSAPWKPGTSITGSACCENAWKLIWENPVLGSVTTWSASPRWGWCRDRASSTSSTATCEVTLRSGLVGLVLFAGVLAAALFSAMVRARRRSGCSRRRPPALGRSLAAAQLTVMRHHPAPSAASCVIPWVYWCLAGMLVGYARVVHAWARARRAAPAPALRFA
jgi:hypothetical protein